ncbi:MAG TPA: hypothetical protein DIW82_02920 [Corynebacterium nuruki]|uniref:Uncharacterized protein n=1 Tax=Corynebacterium nuruki TaxID=1032851 RepID=A0A3D4SWU7_9CORY|nr:hypothetical protein [Corynebacterium nuruki]
MARGGDAGAWDGAAEVSGTGAGLEVVVDSRKSASGAGAALSLPSEVTSQTMTTAATATTTVTTAAGVTHGRRAGAAAATGAAVAGGGPTGISCVYPEEGPAVAATGMAASSSTAARVISGAVGLSSCWS